MLWVYPPFQMVNSPTRDIREFHLRFQVYRIFSRGTNKAQWCFIIDWWKEQVHSSNQGGWLRSSSLIRISRSSSGETPHGANPIPWRLRPASFRTSMLRRWASIQSTRNLDLAAVSSHVLWCNDVGGINTCKVILRISYNAVGSELALRNFHARPSIEIEHTADSLTQRMLVSGRNRRLELCCHPGPNEVSNAGLDGSRQPGKGEQRKKLDVRLRPTTWNAQKHTLLGNQGGIFTNRNSNYTPILDDAPL